MGNCLLGGMGDGGQLVVRVTTVNGGVMEFRGPVTVESITDEFPGHGIFRSQDLFWKPLSHSEVLLVGESYHLLPLVETAGKGPPKPRPGHVRSNSAPLGYRMSVDSRGITRREEVAPKKFWKVKLVISTEQLMEILAEERKTGELIESVRTVAKCESGLGGFSDHWSLSSSRNAASSNKDSLLDF